MPVFSKIGLEKTSIPWTPLFIVLLTKNFNTDADESWGECFRDCALKSPFEPASQSPVKIPSVTLLPSPPTESVLPGWLDPELLPRPDPHEVLL